MNHTSLILLPHSSDPYDLENRSKVNLYDDQQPGNGINLAKTEFSMNFDLISRSNMSTKIMSNSIFLVDGIMKNIFKLVANKVKLIRPTGQRSKFKKDVLATVFCLDL